MNISSFSVRWMSVCHPYLFTPLDMCHMSSPTCRISSFQVLRCLSNPVVISISLRFRHRRSTSTVSLTVSHIVSIPIMPWLRCSFAFLSFESMLSIAHFSRIASLRKRLILFLYHGLAYHCCRFGYRRRYRLCSLRLQISCCARVRDDSCSCCTGWWPRY